MIDESSGAENEKPRLAPEASSKAARPIILGRGAQALAFGWALAFAFVVYLVADFLPQRHAFVQYEPRAETTVFDDDPANASGADPKQPCLTTYSATHPSHLRIDHTDEIRITAISLPRLANVREDECRSRQQGDMARAKLTGVAIEIQPEGEVLAMPRPDGAVEWLWQVRPTQPGNGHALFRCEAGGFFFPLRFGVYDDFGMPRWLWFVLKGLGGLFALLLAWPLTVAFLKRRFGLPAGDE